MPAQYRSWSTGYAAHSRNPSAANTSTGTSEPTATAGRGRQDRPATRTAMTSGASSGRP